MKDALLSFTKALPNAGANNASDVIDLLQAVPEIVHRQGYLEVAIPAMANHTNTSANVTFELQDSTVNTSANFANTSPLLRITVPGVASTGSAASTVKVPFLPDQKRYVRILQTATANATTNNLEATYAVVIP